MRKILSLVILLSATTAFAQPDNRVFTILKQKYNNLASPTVMTNPQWDDWSDFAEQSVPLGFNYTMLGQTTDSIFFKFSEGCNILFDTVNNTTTGITMGMDLKDRNNILPAEFSEIGYQTQTASGKKITKIEWKNVGLYGEMGTTNTANDYLNFQYWFYENDNDFEIHFGTSSIATSYSIVFDYSGPFVGMAKNMLHEIDDDFEWLYYVSSVSTPKVDSINYANFQVSSVGFGTFPKDSTVFRFSKGVPQGLNGVALNEYINVFPTLVQTSCTVALNKPNFTGTILLFDMNGKMVLQQDVRTGKNILQMSELPSGTYVLNIRSSEASIFYKIIKQ